MRRSLLPVALAATCFVLADVACADVVVRLKSGTELYASHTWTENGLVKFEHRGGIVGFPESAVESVTETDVHAPIVRARHSKPAAEPVDAAAATEDAIGDGSEQQPTANETQHTVAATAPAAGTKAGDAATVNAAAVVEPVPEVKNEDLQTRSERLDDLSLKTHRELSVARSRGDPTEVVNALEAKVEEIDRQRAATMKAMGSLH